MGRRLFNRIEATLWCDKCLAETRHHVEQTAVLRLDVDKTCLRCGRVTDLRAERMRARQQEHDGQAPGWLRRRRQRSGY